MREETSGAVLVPDAYDFSLNEKLKGGMQEMIVRAVLGGFVVSSFALLGDVLKPKSFAGLFGAAPSVALATLALAVHKHGAGYAALKRIPCFWVRLRSSFMRRRRAV